MKNKKPYMFKRGRAHLRVLPVLIWVAAILGTCSIFFLRTQRFEVVGIARSEEHTIAADRPGRLKNVPVQLYQEVKEGETLAIVKLSNLVEDEYLRAQLAAQRATAESELTRLKYELEAVDEQLKAEEAERKNEYSSEHRRMSLDVERTRISILELKTTIEPDQILLKDLELELKIVQDLLKKGAVEEYELKKVQTEYDALAKKISENKVLLAQVQEDLKQAEQRLEEFANNKPAPVLHGVLLAPINQAIKVQEKRIEELLLQRDTLILTAPFDAVVCSITKKTGEAILAGEPIMTIVKDAPSDIIAYADQNKISQIHLNMKVEVIKKSHPARIMESEIIYMGPQMELIPERLWMNPDIPEWGRPIRIAYNKEIDLIPNETVGIRGI